MCEMHTTLLGVIARLVGRGKERQTIEAAARSGNAGGDDVCPTLERYFIGMLREATRSACRRTAARLPRLGRHGNRRFHKGMDLAMIGKRAGFRKREAVGSS